MTSMEMVVHDVEQGSDAWKALRCGVVTASKFKDVMAKGQGLVRSKLLRVLAGEIVTGQPAESFSNGAMDRGKRMEAAIRSHYAFQENVSPEIVGFVTRGRWGCSPDAFLGTDGVLEIKSQQPDLLIETFRKGAFPSEHICQCQGALLLTDRDYCDIAVGYTGMPLFVKRAGRDTRLLLEMRGELNRFTDELDAMVEEIKGYGLPMADIGEDGA